MMDTGVSISVNLLSNVVYRATNINRIFSNFSCAQCACAALLDAASGWNCITNNSTCQLIKNYSSTDDGLMILSNASFFYLQLPPQAAYTKNVTTVSTTSSSTSTTTTTVTMTFPSCTTTPASNLLQRNGATPWTLFSFNYTAVTSAPTLMFGFNNGPADTNYLDDVSIILASAPLIQLLQNPAFENSSSTPTGWITSCQSGCGAGDQGQITSSSCYSGNCYIDHCQNPNYDFLAQSFPATIGYNYIISFRLYQTGGTAGRFYANIYD
ncbi:unnamed protein product [Adineta ricciae]|uniref:Uncharacterized protein n=1 Tax=Adineta ricciae TaxID=249248 RepID=A0A814DJD4_ADIRI|nr:unnamed protein product [Adineta ricciae]